MSRAAAAAAAPAPAGTLRRISVGRLSTRRSGQPVTVRGERERLRNGRVTGGFMLGCSRAAILPRLFERLYCAALGMGFYIG